MPIQVPPQFQSSKEKFLSKIPSAKKLAKETAKITADLSLGVYEKSAKEASKSRSAAPLVLAAGALVVGGIAKFAADKLNDEE